MPTVLVNSLYTILTHLLAPREALSEIGDFLNESKLSGTQKAWQRNVEEIALSPKASNRSK